MVDDGRHSQIVGIKEDVVQFAQCNGIIEIAVVSAEIEIANQSEDVKSHRDGKDHVIESKDKEIDLQAEHEESAPIVQYGIKSAKMLQRVNAAEANHVIDRSVKRIVIRLNEKVQQKKMLSDDR